ncbi:Hsp70 family protein [Flavitalea sp. BT771]|uniref:Hsp70 family protein n=1 Tax=Flavitalea sp. BT771 TaxID=3063329 RepID=UPI0026E32574|nr:Hsp70 family protein [Flavitalea sp. BT771]MDO6432062.1 Hsp70 family protein [Flavitalea sp. BT771]MDV6220971.1 Hsp70 family protein [Flavitalea sp. BT771]
MTINFAIDLGTTNSLIARARNGNVEIFKNPSGMKVTLPSVVAFRKDRMLIGDKAKEYIEKDPANVFGTFKRKMGTSESFFVANNGSFKTPVELSAMILQELRNFIFTGESPESVIITIPASFDTIQSNATKEAGYAAGFKEVLLLQEPIAASLAFANKEGCEGMKGQWLVYDLGGGTFDVALVKIDEDEMKVVDHEGDNFFGGVDFDNLIITQLFVPYLEDKYGITDLSRKMLSANGKYNKLYYQLLYKAEEAKISLSNHSTAEVEFDMEDESGQSHEVYFTIDKGQFNSIIREKIQASVNFIRNLLERNNLRPADITEIVLVGGSTYIPLVRTMLNEELQIAVNTSIDPTTAVVEGAAYYAGSRISRLEQAPAANVVKSNNSSDAPLIEVKTAYQHHSREQEEYFAASIKNAPVGSHYRIVRTDGGFDSGLKKATERISEMLLLLPNTQNVFQLKIYDEKGRAIDIAVPDIAIVQGKFTIYGQPLPNDICLEVDDVENNMTHLEVIFERNAILPLKRSITKTLSRTIAKGSDDQLLINVLEGSRYSSPQSNLSIGVVSIAGKDLSADLIKGCDVDLSFEISESRDITVKAYISMIDAEFGQVFNPSVRSINMARMQEEADYLYRVGKRQLDGLLAKEKYEESAVLQQAMDELSGLQRKIRGLSADDVTDVKYQLDDQKRKLAQVVAEAERGDRMLELKEEYFEKKESYQYMLQQSNDIALKHRFEAISKEENEWINQCSTQFLRMKIHEMDRLIWNVKRKDVGYLTSLYLHYAMKPDNAYSDVKQIKALKARGDEALERKNPDEIASVIYRMYDLLIDKDDDEVIKGTGLRG